MHPISALYGLRLITFKAKSEALQQMYLQNWRLRLELSDLHLAWGEPRWRFQSVNLQPETENGYACPAYMRRNPL